MNDRFDEMAERVQLAAEAYGLRHNIDSRKRVIAEALRAAHARGLDEGRAVGRADVGKYSNAIGRIEAVIGYSGARPLADTVNAVEQELFVLRDLNSHSIRERERMAGEIERLSANGRRVVELLRRIITYAREDRARTPGFTRLARALEEADGLIREEPK
jgi:hypothetical protein